MNDLDFLINYLLKERGESVSINSLSLSEKEKLYRVLVNIREPKNISDDYLDVEDRYLKNRLSKLDVTLSSSIKTISDSYQNTSVRNGDKIALWKGDITRIQADAIVNAGNSGGTGCYLPNHNCIDNQINTFSGVRLRLECNSVMKKLDYNLETGTAIITKGYNLPCSYVIETVGPIINGSVSDSDKNLLSNCYLNSLKLAVKNNIRIIVFPTISTGVFHFPKDIASSIAISTADNFISDNRDKIDKVIFSLYSDEDVKVYEDNIK